MAVMAGKERMFATNKGNMRFNIAYYVSQWNVTLSCVIIHRNTKRQSRRGTENETNFHIKK